MGTVFRTGSTDDTLIALNLWTALFVHLTFTGIGATTHANIFHGTAKASFFVPLKVVKGNHNISIHNGSANLCAFNIFTALNRNIHIVRTFQSVCNNHLATSRIRCEAIAVSCIDMIQCVFTGADVHSICISQKGLATEILNDINQHSGITRAQMGHVAKFAKMDFNCHKFILKVNLVDTSSKNQTSQAVLDGRPHFHVSLVRDVSPYCDCHPENDIPIVPDVGMFASFDPVALDLACAEAVNAQVVNPGSKLAKANRPDLDNLTGAFPHTSWRSQISHAKKIGLGEDSYELVKI